MISVGGTGTAPTGGSSLRDKQIASISQMLNLNESGLVRGGKDPKEPVWKILIYDRVGMEILTPLFTVHELRQNGITLHIPLHSGDRSSSSSSSSGIPDVPAIYFALPSDENVERISRDIQSGLYGNYYLNFFRPIPRSKIEDLATAVLASGDTKCVSKVYDQYVDFVCLEDGLFTLASAGSPNDFYGLNRPSVTDSEMASRIESIVDGLFSVLVTYGQVPVIRTPKGGAAESIGEKLDKKIRDNLRDHRSSLFNDHTHHSSSGFSFSSGSSSPSLTSPRPLLVIYDRTLDLATPLAHAWTYQALTHDVLENSQNQIKFSDDDTAASSESSSKKQRVFSLDSRRDIFWRTHRGSPFPTVAEAIQTDLEEYRKSEDEVKRLKETVGGNNVEENNLMDMDISDNTAKLSLAIRDLPQLIERKRVLDAHTSIATAILSQIKSRSLDAFYETESKLLTAMSSSANKSSSSSVESVAINSMLLDQRQGTFEDKLRLFLIYYLANKATVSDTEMEQLASSLVDADNTNLLDAIQFVKRWISFSKMTSNPQYSSLQSSSSSRGGGVVGGVASSSMLTKLVSTGSSFLMEGVRNLVYKRQDLPLTRVTLDLVEGGHRETEESYRYFDPKQIKSGGQQQQQQRPAGFNSDCIVFVVGGGTYMEYQNLVDCFSQRRDGGVAAAAASSFGRQSGGPQGQQSNSSSLQGGKRVTYGSTYLYNGADFLAQLAKLGAEK